MKRLKFKTLKNSLSKSGCHGNVKRDGQAFAKLGGFSLVGLACF